MHRFVALSIAVLLFAIAASPAEAEDNSLPPPPLLINEAPASETITNLPPPPEVPNNPLSDLARLNASKKQFSGSLTQPLDHSAKKSQTFSQKYYIDTRFAADPKKAPVIYELCGESGCSARTPLGLEELAERQHAVIVQLEHRYYSDAKAVANLSKENLKYLTVAQALADTKIAQQQIQKNFGLLGPWIVTGCSYPGALAAFYRSKYPELVKGAIVSAAPVKAEWNFAAYEAIVSQKLGQECSRNARTAIRDLEGIFTKGTPEEQTHWLKRLGYRRIQSPDSIMSALGNEVSAAVQFGQSAAFCSAIASAKNVLDGFVDYINKEHAGPGVGYIEAMSDLDILKNPDSPDPIVWNMRAWSYQTCSQFGFAQPASLDCSFTIFSRLNSIAWYESFCRDSFGLVGKDKIDKFNSNYYEEIQSKKTLNILFITGSEDPWRYTSIRSANNRNPGNTTFTVEGGSHCSERGVSHNPSDAKARALIEKNFSTWAK